MAGASMNDIKSRIKSVRSTMQITKAMELVATSKLRRAKERAEGTRPYYEALSGIVSGLLSSAELSGAYTGERECKTALFVVIAGDRGLAGGYNANVYRLTSELSKSVERAVYLPIGKRAIEYYGHRGVEIFKEGCYAADTGVGESFDIARVIFEAYEAGTIDKVVLVYTKFISMISQIPVYEELLPLSGEELTPPAEILVESEPEEILKKVIPELLGGIIYSAVCEAVASECGARRTAMNSANKNAAEMIDTLMLKFNRARQAVITQEITEIVSGAEAL